MSAATFDCLACGACCRHGQDGTLLIHDEDLVLWKRVGRQDLVDAIVPGHFSQMAFPYTEEGACKHLGTPGQINACSIYEIRGKTCRDFEPGCPQCLTFRRAYGLPT